MAITIANQRWIFYFTTKILCIELVAVPTIISASFCIIGISIKAITITNPPNKLCCCAAVRIVVVELDAISIIKPASFGIIWIFITANSARTCNKKGTVQQYPMTTILAYFRARENNDALLHCHATHIHRIIESNQNKSIACTLYCRILNYETHL